MPPDPTPRTVRPRQSRYLDLPIVAIDIRENVLTEEGEVKCLDDLIDELLTADGYLLVAMRSARVLARIQTRYQHFSTWQSKTLKRERVQYVPELKEKSISFAWEQVIPIYCGWKRGNTRWHHLQHRYSYFLDPVMFYGNAKTVQDIFGLPEEMSCPALMKWAQGMRIFCYENDLPYKQTSGALSAQFLTDRRFYPEPRRKVPKATNDRMRTKLPGNHSVLVVSPGTGRVWNGFYLDQRRAHHYHARTTKLPNSNSLFAYGDFARLKRLSFPGDAFLDGDFSGYVCGDFTPPADRVLFLPPRWRRRTISRRFVSTAEWPFLSDLGVRCLGLFAAWGSRESDTGIPAYSRHAESELDLWESRSHFGNTWLKPILVSTYGVLAINVDRVTESLLGSNDSRRDLETAEWPAADMLLHGFLVRNTKGAKVEPGITNVLHRGLIESATRTESIAYSNYVSRQGYRVLMIHVDGVIIEDGGELPDPPEIDPWRIKTYMTGIQFYDEQSFSSLEMTRMPGRPLHRRMTKVSPNATRIDGSMKVYA